MSRSPGPSTPDFQKRYAVLLDIGRILTGTLEADQLYRLIYEQASRVIETTGFYIALHDADADRATVVFYADRGAVERPGVTYRGSDSRAIREGRPVLEKVEAPERAVMLLGPESDEELTRSVISAPMLHEGQVLGAISAQSYHADAYTEDDLELLLAVADLAAVAVYNARTVQELERQRHESEQLEQIGRALTASLELNEVLERIVDAIQRLTESAGAGVWLMGEGRALTLAATAGDAVLPTGTSVPLAAELVDRVLRDPEPMVFDLAEEHELVPPEVGELLDGGSALAVPLIAEDRLVGALTVTRRTPAGTSPSELLVLRRFAHQAAVAVANARLHEQIRLLSMTDPLTELPNRRHMQMFLEKEFAAAERGRALTVILYDLDNFKLYNDAEGHQAGDAVLRRFAEILAHQTRAMNLAARYGGDEFITILSDTDMEGGAIHAGRVMKAVREDEIMARVGASAGMASYEPEMKTPDELLRKADEQLYAAKGVRERKTPAG